MTRAQLIAFFMFVLLGCGFLLAQFVTIDLANERVQQAFVAGLVVGAGWLITFLLRELSLLLDIQERRRDMIRAVRAEVELIQYFAGKVDWDKAIDAVRKAYETDPDYKPFIAYGRQYAVLRRLVDEIEILDTGTQIRAVIDMFQLMDRMDQLEARISGRRFGDLPVPRQIEVMVRYFKMQQVLPDVAERVLTQLRSGSSARG